MKRRFIVVLTVLSMFATLCTLSTVFAEPVKKEKKAKIKLVYSIEGVLPPDADEKLVSILRGSGWVVHGKNISKRILGRNYDFIIDGTPTKSDGNGEIELSLGMEEEEFEIDDSVTGKVKQKIKSNTTTTIERKIDFHSLLAGMGDHSENGAGHTSDHNYDWLENGEQAYHYRDVHCNRFNGQNGDGKYYSNEFSSGAITNFAQSDCDWALALWILSCLKDYAGGFAGIDTYCAGEPKAKNANCSDWADIYPWVEHAEWFHMHTSPNAPIS